MWLSVKEITQDDWEKIRQSLQRARLWLIVPALLMLFMSHFSRAIRWKILMEPLGYKPSNLNTFAAVMIGYLVNAGVPRLGEVVKCTILARYEKVRADQLVGTIVMERAVDAVCLALVFLIALLFQGHIIGDFVGSLFGNFFKDQSGETSFTKIIIAAGGFFLFLIVVYLLLKRFGHIDAVSKVKNVLKGILHGLQSIRFIRHKGWFVFHTVLIWVLYLLSTTVGIYALQETAHLGLNGGLTTLAVGSVGMILTPGGIGAYPALVAQLMGVYGLNEKITGTTLGWLLWSVQTFIILVGGLIMIALFSYCNKNKKPGEERTRFTDEDIAAIRFDEDSK